MLPDALRSLFARQRGTVTVRQLAAAGVTERQRRAAVAQGFLERVGEHGYRSPLAPRTLEDDLAALVLDCAPAWASGPTAAALDGFDGFALRRPFHITVLRGRNIVRTGAIVHTVTSLPLIDRAEVRGIPMTRAPRTIIDLGATCSVNQLTTAIDSMLRDGRGSEDLLHRRIVALRAPGRRGIRKVIAAVEGADAQRGGHSYLERRYLELVAAAGLPRPDTQVHPLAGRAIRVDCRWPGTSVVVELLGYRWHRTKTQLMADARRMNELVLRGLDVYQFTYDQVVGEPDAVVATTTVALRR